MTQRSASPCKSCKVRPRTYKEDLCEYCKVDKVLKADDLVRSLKRMRDGIQAQIDVDNAMKVMRLR